MRTARILILRGGAIGDFIVTLPAIQALRNRWPDSYIELIGYPHVAQLAAHAGLVNRVRSLDEARIARLFAWNVRIEEDDQSYYSSFDFVLNYLHDPEQVLTDYLKRCGVRVVINGSPLNIESHATEHFLRPLHSLAIFESDPTPMLELQHLAKRPEDKKPPWVAVHPGSGSRRKNWPIHNFIDLARRLDDHFGLRPVFITGDAECESIPDLDMHLLPFSRLHNLNLIELAVELTCARLFIGNDGGITHLAASVGCPTMALFGPTNPAIWSPRGRVVHILSSRSQIMNDLHPEDVWAEVESFYTKGVQNR